jgi:hypothetical protein
LVRSNARTQRALTNVPCYFDCTTRKDHGRNH